jgi:hypothetical protein
MSEYRSQEQEGPEQRIRELERGLADTNQPAPQDPAQCPDCGVSPTAGSTPSWPSMPFPSGDPDARAFGRGRGGLRWTGTLVGFVFSIAMILVFTVPWKDLGFFEGLFGQTKVRQPLRQRVQPPSHRRQCRRRSGQQHEQHRRLPFRPTSGKHERQHLVTQA